jgi:hypothetical protein
MTTEKTRTAILTDKNNNPVPVHARLCENWDGATDLDQTKKRIIEETPGLTWEGWVYDIRNENDLMELRCCFLSPNVWEVKKWITDGNNIQFRKVTAEEVAS